MPTLKAYACKRVYFSQLKGKTENLPRRLKIKLCKLTIRHTKMNGEMTENIKTKEAITIGGFRNVFKASPPAQSSY